MSNDNRVYYKVLGKDMCSPYRGFLYELGKAYSTDRVLSLCNNGYHTCRNMYELLLWTKYNTLKDCRFFECTLGDKIIEDTHKVVSDSITLIREISFEEVDKSIRDNLDILVHDEDWVIRRAVAEQGYGLDILINDEDWYVRKAVAEQGYGLDILIHDEDANVRTAVALQEYGLDILINDEDFYVRETVARRGYGLDTLIHDKDMNVREVVAEQGYGLDILIKDESLIVRNIAKRMLEKEKGNE